MGLWIGWVVALVGVPGVAAAQAGTSPTCARPVYLTFDTGHMGVAALIGETLSQNQVKATFFAANEKAKTGESSLSDDWGSFWRSMGQQGHEFASHTYDHVVWRGDGAAGQFQVRPTAGSQTGQTLRYTPADYCGQLDKASKRIGQLTQTQPLPLFRAPGGKTSAQLLAAAKSCGYLHVPWAAAGFLGDELPSEKYPNQVLLERALATIRPGDILLAHLGIWSRQDPWAPAVLGPLIRGLKQKGFCFETLSQHPDYRAWVAQPRKSS